MKLVTLLLGAWVLWANVETDGRFTDGSKWKSIDAYMTKTDCEVSRAEQSAQRVAVERALSKHTGGADVILFRCLPDTIGPRGPKR